MQEERTSTSLVSIHQMQQQFSDVHLFKDVEFKARSPILEGRVEFQFDSVCFGTYR